ncbi:hypothetical protein FE783_31510 [Paenibacillus mesophilus]|uniref:hypothetical protein n=1 Tax=Paenibacillus mesophilus TaxID=2582849 RepID=UPI00110DF174|nr:hypothetical protein [Paenibacillus mesophilus]TMV44688.1 hypothetical protein FE783_31510 [Paenibacillus mesophilus]
MNVLTQKNGFFKDRNTAMFLSISGLQYAQLEGMNFVIASFPSDKEAPGVGAQPYPTIFSVTNISKYKDDAFDVIAYLTSGEIQTEPARPDGCCPSSKTKRSKALSDKTRRCFRAKM